MLALMFNSRFKNMWFVTTFLGCENVVIVIKYDEKSLLPLLLEANKLLMFASVKEIEDLQSQVNAKDLFHSTRLNANNYRNLVLKELVKICHYHVDVENCKCTLFWWCKEKTKFPTIFILAQYIISIPTNQIKIMDMLFIVGILIALHRCHVQTNNMDKLIFVNKN
jgi:hypothetical protein